MMSFNQAAETFTMMDYISSIVVRLKQTEDMETVRDELRGLPGSKALEVMGWDELLPELIQHIVMDKISLPIFFMSCCSSSSPSACSTPSRCRCLSGGASLAS